MQPSSVAQGAKRFVKLTGKSGKMDFYKGTRQAYLPGTSLRTGPPGHHIIGGTGNYQLDDSKVRYYIAPPIQMLNNTTLTPFVYNPIPEHLDPDLDPDRLSHSRPHLTTPKLRLPPFSPLPLRSIPLSDGTTLPSHAPKVQDPLDPSHYSSAPDPRRQTEKDKKEFAKNYKKLTIEQRMGLIMKSRREWWEGMVARTQAGREVEAEVEEGQ